MEEPTNKEYEEWAKQIPMDALELQSMTIDSSWGRGASPSLQRALTLNGEVVTDKNGKMITYQDFLFEKLSYLARDLRYGNLSDWDEYVAHAHLNFAGLCLRLGLKDAFMSAYSQVAHKIETSQSRKGFFRRQLGTSRREMINEFSDKSQKKGLFSSKKNGGN